MPVLRPHGYGEIILRLRKERGLSQSELSRRSGVDRAYISQLESGKIQMPGDPMREKLSKGLGLSDEYILGLMGLKTDKLANVDPMAIDQDEHRLVVILRKLPDRDRDLLMGIAELIYRRYAPIP